MSKLRWSYSEPGVRGAIEPWLRDGFSPSAQVLADNARRQLVRIDSSLGPPLVLKQFKQPARAKGIRKRWRKQLAAWGFSRLDREWRALTQIQRANISAPRPMGRAQVGRHQSLIVCSFLPGVSLQEALAAPVPARWQTLRSIGALVGQLHASGRVHGDLHVGNLLIGPEGPALLDVGGCRRRILRRETFADLGALDFSLAHAGVSLADRMRVRLAALGAPNGVQGNRRLRRAIRRIAARSHDHGRSYYRSRTRRCLREGRRYASLEIEGRRGMRVAEFPEKAVCEALAAHREALSGSPGAHDEVLKSDHRARITGVRVADRRVVVKEVVKRGVARWIADGFRGSPAQRAWVGGHGLAARGLRAATPLAYTETRNFGVPTASIVILEDLRPALPVSQPEATGLEGQALADWAVDLALRLHRRGVVHGDLQALHIYACHEPGMAPQPALIDLEGVRFRRRLSDATRIQALAELNASLEDKRANASARCTAFARYARMLPFRRPAEHALARVVKVSLGRRHKWRGAAADTSPPDQPRVTTSH